MTSLVYNDGTASVTYGSAVVTGNGTAWQIALVAGGMFSLAGVSVPILSVDTDTQLTLAYPWPGGDEDDVAYAIARETSQAVRAAWINDRLATFHQKPWGIGVEPDGRGTLDERDALDPMPSDYYCWLRVEVDEPVELYFKVPSGWIGPYAIMGEDGPPGAPGPALVPAGEWVADTNYPRGRYVSHGGRSFASKVNENEGNEPPDADEDDAFWMFVPLPVGPKGDKGDQGDKGDKGDKGDTGVIWRGTYSGATSYAANDAVSDNGSSWLALQETTGNAPPTLPTTSNAYWELLAAKGTDGTGTGDFVGPDGGVTDGHMVLFDGTTGKLGKSAGKAPFSGDYDDLSNKPTLGTMAAETASDYTKTSGLGGAALLNVGTTASTVAAGDDSRIAGALQSADVASFAQFNATTADKVLKTDSVWSDLGVLTDASTIAISFNNGYDFGGASNVPLAIAGNRTLGAPQNVRNGKKGVLWFTASGATRTLTLHANWILAAGVEAGPYSITTSQTLGIAYVSRGTTVIVTGIIRIG